MKKTILCTAAAAAAAAITVIAIAGCNDYVGGSTENLNRFLDGFGGGYTPVNQYTLTLNVWPADGGSTDPSAGGHQYDEGTSVSISATKFGDYEFDRWTGASHSTNPEITITMNSNMTLTAIFKNERVSTLFDDRNNKEYRTVKINNQWWMAENVDYAIGNSWCYMENNCRYGRLYDWNTANNGACPSGWRLPTRREWGDLAIAADGTGDYGDGGTAAKKLKSGSGWDVSNGKSGNGTDDFGFSALPGSYRYSVGGFSDVSSVGFWWTSATDGGNGGNAYYRHISYDKDNVFEGSGDKGFGFSVRCVLDN